MEKCDKILIAIAEICENCGSSSFCPEEECVIYKIEQIIADVINVEQKEDE